MSEVRDFAIERVRFPLKMRLLRVKEVSRELPNFVRITLQSDDLHDFQSASFDDHVKLFFPEPGCERPVLPEVGANGLIFPEGQVRPTVRDYTPRLYDPLKRELVLDFAVHNGGAAITWAQQAQPGHYLGMGGPRGSMVIPSHFDWHFLIGDETAYPAIARRLEELPAQAQVYTFIEVDDPSAQLPLNTKAQLSATWLYRRDQQDEVKAFVDALSDTALPEGEGFIWAAAESAVIKAVHQHFVTVRGVDKSRIRASNYWKHGVKNAPREVE